MRIADRRWRLLALAVVVCGTALILIEAFARGTGPIAGVDADVLGFVLIVAGLVLFFGSQRAANRAEGGRLRPSDASSEHEDL